MTRNRLLLSTVAAMAALSAYAARKPGQPLKPGFNMFSRQQDIELGQMNAKQVSAQYATADNAFLQAYVGRIGNRLANTPEARASQFPFNFTVLNVGEINAFALPGGPMFIYSGLLKACDNEAQLAGVMGHEMAHVILRHGTHEATKANFIQLPVILAGSLLGNETKAAQLGNMGLMLGANCVILRFSRDAESEADALGSHLMAEAGYDPVQMARFFEKLTSGQQSATLSQFFSDHPNPGNREKAIQDEMRTLAPHTYGYDTGEFARMKTELNRLPPPPPPKKQVQPAQK